MKRIIIAIMLLSFTSIIAAQQNKTIFDNIFIAFDNTVKYKKTDKVVTIVTETGQVIGAFKVYIHLYNKYIRFKNSWIWIQGRKKFAYNDDWYTIK